MEGKDKRDEKKEGKIRARKERVIDYLKSTKKKAFRRSHRLQQKEEEEEVSDKRGAAEGIGEKVKQKEEEAGK